MSDWVYIEVAEIRRLTDKAICCLMDDGEEIWLPLSQIAPVDRDSLEVGDTDIGLSVTSWIANEKGLQ